MKKTLVIAIGIMLLTFVSALVFAESGLDVATPQAGEQQAPPSDQIDPNDQATPGNVSISKRNKAKLEVEQQRRLKQEQIDKERAAAEATQQTQQ